MDYLTLAYILLAVGIVLLMAELFIPTGGICFVLAAAVRICGYRFDFLLRQHDERRRSPCRRFCCLSGSPFGSVFPVARHVMGKAADP